MNIYIIDRILMSDEAIKNYTASSQKIITHLEGELSKLQTGRASSGLVEHMSVDLYGSKQPLKNIASISIPDARSIQIQPWDKGALSAIEKAIQISGIGINPVNNGTSIILNLPMMTEERRKELCKVVKKIGEESKIAVRQARHEAIDSMKKAELPEDQLKGAEKRLQEQVDKSNKEVEETTSKKENEIMKI